MAQASVQMEHPTSQAGSLRHKRSDIDDSRSCSRSVLLGSFLFGKVFFLAGMLVGCDRILGNGKDHSYQIESLEMKADLLANRLNEIDRRDALENTSPPPLKVSEKEFTTVPTSYGPMTASIDDVAAYANGSRVTLSIGNLSAATMRNCKVLVDWGASDGEGNPIRSPTRISYLNLEGDLPRGAFTEKRINLANVPPAQLGWVHVADISCDRIVLTTQK